MMQKIREKFIKEGSVNLNKDEHMAAPDLDRGDGGPVASTAVE